MRASHRLALWAQILTAHRRARAGALAQATALFALVRQSVVEQADPNALRTALDENWAARVTERKTYRKILEQHAGAGPRVLILDASSGLPRPDRVTTPAQGAEVTYPWHLAQAGLHPVSASQRNITTADALAILRGDDTLLQCEAAVIHLGLNDCANRIFSHRERVALSLLGKRLRYRIVGFAKTYRHAILQHLPARHYVACDVFERNLDLIIAALRAAGVHKIVLSTIITPPSSRWAGTPGVNLNFARYNQAILEAAARNGVPFLELDRMVLEGGQGQMLIEDGMHLSDAGNALFADRLYTVLGDIS